jgi:hypothetical protein
MAIFQFLVKADPLLSEELVPSCRQILPLFNELLLANFNIGYKTEHGQWKRINLSDLILETLMKMEKTGKSEALINIGYLISIYQSSHSR